MDRGRFYRGHPAAQHAVEVLRCSDVRNGAAMPLFYSGVGNLPPGATAFETAAAIDAGNAVREEIRKAQSQLKND
jgi:hypothetical protein